MGPEKWAGLTSLGSGIPGVVGTGLFQGMADTVLVAREIDFRLVQERHRGAGRKPRTA